MTTAQKTRLEKLVALEAAGTLTAKEVAELKTLRELEASDESDNESEDGSVPESSNKPKIGELPKLRKPDKGRLVVVIAAESERMKDYDEALGTGKFMRDTVIVRGTDFNTKKPVTIFISANQYKEYDCEKHIFIGNVVSFDVEYNIKDVTGYIKNKGDMELTAHSATFTSFDGISTVTEVELIDFFVEKRYPVEFANMQINMIMKKRSQYETVRNSASQMVAFGNAISADL